MNMRMISNHEIAERQQIIRNDYLRTQHGFSIRGIRHLAGSTMIALGQMVYGRIEDHCEQHARQRLQAQAKGARV